MIEVQNLTKKYGKFVAVDNISFKIEKGQIVGFLGPNGAGKTTTLRVVAGYFPPTSGTCRIADFDIERNALEAKKRIGYLPENNPLYHEMKVNEYLEFIGAIREVGNIKKRIDEVIDICGLVNVVKEEIGELSRGYRQRVGLAQAIIHNPDILILDEPTEGLDPNQVIAVRNLIKELGKEKTVIVSTHILPEAEATCHRILIINRGKIVADSSKEELHTLVKGREIIELELKEEEDISDILREQSFIKEVSKKNKKYEISAEKGMDIRENLFNLAREKGWIILELHKKSTSLEDVFRELTQ